MRAIEPPLSGSVAGVEGGDRAVGIRDGAQDGVPLPQTAGDLLPRDRLDRVGLRRGSGIHELELESVTALVEHPAVGLRNVGEHRSRPSVEDAADVVDRARAAVHGDRDTAGAEELVQTRGHPHDPRPGSTACHDVPPPILGFLFRQRAKSTGDVREYQRPPPSKIDHILSKKTSIVNGAFSSTKKRERISFYWRRGGELLVELAPTRNVRRDRYASELRVNSGIDRRSNSTTRGCLRWHATRSDSPCGQA